MARVIDTCRRCGKCVVKSHEYSSSDLIHIMKLELVFKGDVSEKDEGCRPTLVMLDEECCPDCFLAEITEWVNQLKKRKPSRIDGPAFVLGKPRKVRSDKGKPAPKKNHVAVDPRQSNMEQFIKTDQQETQKLTPTEILRQNEII